MSVDTRTPRTPTGDRSSGIDDAPALSMVKVPSDPAQVIVNHASFRVQLGASTRPARSPRIARHLSATQDTSRMPAAAGAPAPARRRPVVWSGRSEPDDTGAHRLLQAVRAGAGRTAEAPAPADAGATQVIPRVDETVETPLVGAQRGPVPAEGTRLLPAMRTVGSAYDEPGYGQPGHEGSGYGDDGYGVLGTDPGAYDGYGRDDDPDGAGHRSRRHGGDDPARHAYYPGRRMNLGVVLLPLRVFLGFISIYAGMGKLCDPVYFDGGKRGSMVKWLDTLHPWDVAEPLRQFALSHPVGSGLVIAFLQVIVGVLTVLGCWQRVAAVIGAGLSAALLVTVSWKSVPVYDAPDIIYLAAWSPLIIAGAPVYSVDGRLAGSAWRRLGPRADIWELRRYVLRRGIVVTFLVTGVTLLAGSLLGGAVRDADRVVVPGPGEAPRNELPGTPLPGESRTHKERESSGEASSAPTEGTKGRDKDKKPSRDASATPEAARESGTAPGAAPSRSQGGATGQTSPSRRSSSPSGQAPSTGAGPSSGGTSGGAGGSTGGGGAAPGGGDEDGGGSSSTGQPGGSRLVGGLLG
ncbi:DoxX family protein [Streptomyces sp. NPDC003717]|uniref:DoxX family protein n=1 Tax=Streptomyces sp. NPDC003717 TaxID=3154276 RepID=UPI0033BD02ED